ncbi:MAG: D-alanyl-D-alanine carboxypeptidase/D-alanyl-D-alanine-endopeptidase [Acidobacteriia bacterium]|nr:D-alanyl-D-alanine carboxypeptidase/D-alanyl-D-alanine-endopeptidase [Terriglobia bacterium]
MALHRKLPAHLFGCAVFCWVVLAAPADTRAQSRPMKTATSSDVPTSRKISEPSDVAQFRARVDDALSAQGADKGHWGILVADAATGAVLFARNADSFFMPASDAKLFTTALALATLGPDFRVKTKIAASGPVDANGVLNGNLVLIGGGDANLSNRKFPFAKKEERDGPPEKALAEFADQVASRGVKEITGDVVADDSLFQPERFPSGWAIDDIQWSYGAAVSAIAVNDNTFTVELWPGAREGEPARCEAGLAADFYTIENSVRTSAPGVEENLAATRDPGSRLIRLSGTLPAGAHPRVLTFAVERPAEYAATLLAHLLAQRGVKTDGSARARHAGDMSPADALPQNILAERVSQTLSDDVRLTNKNSENLHAELMLLLAAHEKNGAASYDDAVKFAAGFFTAAGIAPGDVSLSDGSGLSRKDLVTPRALVQILRYAAAQPWGELYRASLPEAGEDGTLADRMKGTPAAGRVFAKTGTIGHTNALSGYATTVKGERLIFSIVGNNNTLHAADANKVVDAIVVAMTEELGEAPAVKRNEGCRGCGRN